MIRTVSASLREFMKQESAGGIVLIIAALLAFLIANSALQSYYFAGLDLELALTLGGVGIEKPLLLWINDALMALFFFLVGLEVKREVLDGQLSSWKQASLPLFAAIGGMAIPALVFIILNQGSPENIRGWAIPTATDIAFALGILALMGNRVPVALKAFLLAVAVIDDIGAISIIALFYSGGIDWNMLGGAVIVFAAMVIVGKSGTAKSWPFVILGIIMWVFVLKSGVHATLAGVAAALTVPLAADGQRPLERMEHALHPWVAFVVVPIFAFANAGVSLAGVSAEALLAPLPLGIALGLIIGKQIGILGFSWLATVFKIAELPSDLSWRHIHGVSLIAGIGFTMSLFIGNLAFDDAGQIALVKLGVLSGSLICALLGFILLRMTPPVAQAEATPAN